jgi:aryl carrier-like protein
MTLMFQDLRRGFRDPDRELSPSCSIAKKLVPVAHDHVEDRIETVFGQRLIKIGDKTVKLIPIAVQWKRIGNHVDCSGLTSEPGLAWQPGWKERL